MSLQEHRSGRVLEVFTTATSTNTSPQNITTHNRMSIVIIPSTTDSRCTICGRSTYPKNRLDARAAKIAFITQGHPTIIFGEICVQRSQTVVIISVLHCQTAMNFFTKTSPKRFATREK